ncbi:SUKH-4 family immunity protein [Streptomyces sp. NBC_00878]|uniref:SUKH-4 family immunity protein n=1 Tax=Streptomyces sp. NBC_00878 TaxID=2975854 RepID=UPI0022559A25|nr:SUKH-4 family immunity protein [Streptomyces sp. NBC_00878]MCX4910043.1 SUKH-4 family immunity protein [Streptomyces sp. NBC_00878]
MVRLYGRENVYTATPEDADRFGLSPADSDFLVHVGLPRHAPPFFTTQVEGGPDFLEVIDFTTSEGEQRELVVGGPPGDPEMRFSLDVNEGFITLAVLRGDDSHGEIVNNSLGDFIEFIYRIDEHARRVAGDPSVREESLQELSAHLRSIDQFSFERADDWWAVALHLLAGGGIDI